MPTDIYSRSNGELLIVDENGKTHKFTKFETINELSDNTGQVETTSLHDGYVGSYHGSIAFDFPVSEFTRTRIYQILFSNNWLKMHGYPMRRRWKCTKRILKKSQNI